MYPSGSPDQQTLYRPVLPHFDPVAARASGALPRSFSAPLFGLWDLTYRCTLRCIHCFNNSGSSDKLETSYQEAMDIARQIAQSGVLSMCMSGGDALLHPAYFDCAKTLREAGITVNTISNGWLVSDQMADRMAQCFSLVEVSVDGATEATHDYVRGRPGSFNRVMKAIERLTERGKSVHIAFSPTQANIDEFPALLDLMSTIPGVEAVVTGYILPIGRAYQNQDMLSVDQQESFKEQVLQLRQLYATRLRVSFSDTMAPGIKQLIQRLPNPQFEVCANGDLQAQPWLPIIFGNALTDGLMLVWKSRLAEAWTDPLVQEYAKDIRDNFSLANQCRVPWMERPIPYKELQSKGGQCGV